MNVPKLRFPGFSEEWQAKKLGDIGENVIGLTYSPSEVTHNGTGTIVLRSSNIQENGLSIKDLVLVNSTIPDKLKIQNNDILICTRNGSQRLIGKSLLIKKPINYPNNGLTWGAFMSVFRSPINDFVLLLFNTDTYKKQIQADLGARINQITTGQLNKYKFYFPKRDEQQKIADFFYLIDEKIILQQNQVELLRQYKKGAMQKIFSQKLRFKDKNGQNYPAWQEKRLARIMRERNAQSQKSEDYPLMAFVAYEGVAPKGKRYNREFLVTDSAEKKYKRTELGDFIYSSNNLETGSIGLNHYGPASISPVYSIFEVNKTCDPQFVGSYLLRKEFINKMKKFRQGVIYGQWKIHESDFLKIQEEIPSQKEQQKIANFLNAIDNKIRAEEGKLEQAKLFKKSLLQRMFV